MSENLAKIGLVDFQIMARQESLINENRYKMTKTEAEHLARSPAFSDHPGVLNISTQRSYITKTATFTTIATSVSFALVFVFFVVVEDHTANLAALYSRLDELRQAVNISRRRAARMNVWHLTPLGLSVPPEKNHHRRHLPRYLTLTSLNPNTNFVLHNIRMISNLNRNQGAGRYPRR